MACLSEAFANLTWIHAMIDHPTDDKTACVTRTNDMTTERLNRLEIQASFTEDLVDRLDLIITRQQDQIDQLAREVQRLRQADSAESPPLQRNLRDELPPHY